MHSSLRKPELYNLRQFPEASRNCCEGRRSSTTCGSFQRLCKNAVRASCFSRLQAAHLNLSHQALRPHISGQPGINAMPAHDVGWIGSLLVKAPWSSQDRTGSSGHNGTHVNSQDNDAGQIGSLSSSNPQDVGRPKPHRNWSGMTHEQFVKEVAALNPTGHTSFKEIMSPEEFSEFCARRGKAFSKVFSEISAVCQDVDLVKKLKRIRGSTPSDFNLDTETLEKKVGNEALKITDVRARKKNVREARKERARSQNLIGM